MSKEIQLTQGEVAIVDDTDFEELSKDKWHVNKKRNTFYAERKKDGKTTGMHKQITGYPMTDHINGNGLDNRRENLRQCDKRQNGVNCGIQKNNTSGYKGVFFDKQHKKFRVKIQMNGKRKHIGLFKTAEEAALAYNKVAYELYGEFAKLNRIGE